MNNYLNTKQSVPDFLEEYRVPQENPELLKKQRQLEKNVIDLSTMSDEEIHELNLLYKRQLKELNAILENKKMELRRTQYQLSKM